MSEEKATPAPAPAAPPSWLVDLLAILEAILGAIPSLEGHTIEATQRADVHNKIAALKAKLPK
jgi:hypothetical protein